jgi:hypothetical protein
VTDLPKPLLALLGIASEVRNLPAHAMNAGVTVLGLSYKAREDYAKLVARGERVVTGVFGNSEAAEQPVVPPLAEPPAEAENVVVLDAISHVEDPLEVVRSMPEPLEGYDGMTLGALRGRLRSLSQDDLDRVLRYEKAHKNRAPMVTLVEHRLAKLALE